MSGIAGIMFENGGDEPAGRALIDMLDGRRHRGPDSTDFAVYGDAVDGELRLRFFVGEEEAEPATRSATPRTVSRSTR